MPKQYHSKPYQMTNSPSSGGGVGCLFGAGLTADLAPIPFSIFTGEFRYDQQR